MKLKKINWIGIIFGAIMLLFDLIFFASSEDKNLFLFLVGLAFSILSFPFVIEVMLENKREQEISEMFLEFSRNLAESVNTGTPISKSIINMKTKNYGALTPYVQKLANQISIGIPLTTALHTFAKDIGSPVVVRAVTLISEAEKAGGDIDYILDSSARSIAEIDKLKKERKAAISNLVVQGYIIFFIFIGIMLVMEFKILPLTAGVGAVGGLNMGNMNFNTDSLENANSLSESSKISSEDMAAPFLYLLIFQGMFAGLIIGKLTEGSIKAGIKHSFILTVTAFLVSTGVRLLLG